MSTEDELELSFNDVSIITGALEFMSLRRDLSREEGNLLSYMQQYQKSWPYVPKRKG